MEDSQPTESSVAQVQRHLGRCLIRLQQYEKLLKALIAESNITATPATLLEAKQSRANAVARQTLGQLLGIATESIFRKTGSANENCDDAVPNMPPTEIWISMKWSIELDPAKYEDLLSRFRRLVDVRNSLVHHLLDGHDLSTEDGCSRALAVLDESYALIDREMTQLLEMARNSIAARESFASFVSKHPEVLSGHLQIELLEDHSLVRSLQHAEHALSQDGWTRLEDALSFLRKHHPHETPKRFGFSSWRHVLHESPIFRTKHASDSDSRQRSIWYQSRRVPNA